MISCRGGGKLSRSVYLAPPPTLVSKQNYCANSTYFKLFGCEDVSIEPVHEISNNVVCATSKATDKSARAFASRLSILCLLSY